MPSTWVKRSDGSMGVKDDKEKDDDIEFKPEKLKEDITKDIETRFTDFQTKQTETLKPLLTMAENIERDRLSREKAAKDAAEKKNKEDNQVTDEDFLINPAEATQRLVNEGTKGIARATMMLAARGNIRETMEGKEYYHGDVKSKVDTMIAQQSLEMQCRPDVVENCYKAVVFDHMKDISEGKIKARTSGSTFEGGSTGAHTPDTKESDEVLTADEKQAAKNFGLTEKQWVESKREMTFV
jgi:hypothetical protein